MHILPEHFPFRVFEGFAGYGGASFGLIRSGVRHQVIGFSEVDNDAIESYQYNFPNVRNYGDITQINPNDLPDFEIFTGHRRLQDRRYAGLRNDGGSRTAGPAWQRRRAGAAARFHER